MSRLFFIDSENVGDSWTLLLDAVEPCDKILVFYTQRSPHMSYKNLIHLKESSKEVTFIECFEGSNALDFQLVSELGYQLCAGAGNEFIIVSNDNGFEAAVRYWKKKGELVRRIPAKACLNFHKSSPFAQTYECPENTETPEAPAAAPIAAEGEFIDAYAFTGEEDAVMNPPEENCETLLSEEAQDETSEESQITDVPELETNEDGGSAAQVTKEITDNPNTIPEDALEALYCVGKDNLANLHEALMQLYGNQKCKFLYNTFKSGAAYDQFLAQHDKLSLEDRQRGYCSIVFKTQDTGVALPDDFTETVMKSWKKKKNLNSLRATIQSRYGKENGLKYYSLIKAHVKVLDNIN